MTTVIQSDALELQNFTQDQIQKLTQELQERQQKTQKPLTQQQSQLKQQYAEFLTFKAHGEGAFGSVTEVFDLFRREKLAKKQFKDIQDLKIELDSNDRIETIFPKQELSDIMAGIDHLDIDDNSIFYESGIITLNDFVSKRRQAKVYWYDFEEELNYIIYKLHDLIMKLYKKNVYHSDLKLVNCVICEDKFSYYFLKLIDMGGATFEYNYLIAITTQYFPPQDTFNSTESKENRILAELYQMGRMIQEICLSSIYSKNDKIYRLANKFQNYKEFKSYYFANTQDMIQESIDLIKIYYSDSIVKLLQDILGLQSSEKVITQQISKLKKSNQLKDPQYFVKKISSDKTIKYYENLFQSDKSSNENIVKELEFYLTFQLESQGLYRTQKLLQQKYESLQKCYDQISDSKFNADDSFIIIYYEVFQMKVKRNPDPAFLQDLFFRLNSGDFDQYYEPLKKVFSNKLVSHTIKNYFFTDYLIFNNPFKVSRSDKTNDHLKEIFQLSENTGNPFSDFLYNIFDYVQGDRGTHPEEQENRYSKLKQIVDKALSNKNLDIASQRMITEISALYLRIELTCMNDITSIINEDYYFDKDDAYARDYIKQQFTSKSIQEKMVSFILDKKNREIKKASEFLAQKLFGFTNDNQDQIREHIKQEIYYYVDFHIYGEKSCKYDQEKETYIMLDEQLMKKRYDLIFKCMQSENKYEGRPRTVQSLIQSIYSHSSVLNNNEVDDWLHYADSKGYSIYITHVQNVNGKELYQEINNQRQKLQTIQASQDLSNYPELNTSQFESMLGKDYKQVWDSKKQQYSQPKNLLYLQEMTQFLMCFEQIKSSIKESIHKIDYYKHQNNSKEDKLTKEISSNVDTYYSHIKEYFLKKELTGTFYEIDQNGKEIEFQEKYLNVINVLGGNQLILGWVRALVFVEYLDADSNYCYAPQQAIDTLQDMMKEYYDKEKQEIKNEIILEIMIYILLVQYKFNKINQQDLEFLNSNLQNSDQFTQQQKLTLQLIETAWKYLENNKPQNKKQGKKQQDENREKQSSNQQEAKNSKKQNKNSQKKQKQQQKKQQQKSNKEKEVQEENYQSLNLDQQEEEEQQQPQQQQQQQQNQPKYNKKQTQQKQQQREDTACCTIF